MEDVLPAKILTHLLQQVDHKYYGKYRGIVVDNKDPEQLGRLKAKVPAVLGNDVVTGWAAPCLPYGGAPGQGFFFIPEVEAGVWVEFEAGDLEFPIWVGTYWAKPGGQSEVPTPVDAEGSEQYAVQDPPTRKIIKTLKGHTIQLEDADNEESIIVVEAANGHVLTLDKDGIKITEGTQSHEITLNADGIKTTDGANGHEITLDSSGITITDGANSGNTIILEQSGIKIEDKNGNKLEMDGLSGGIPGTNGVTVNGKKKVCLEGLITFLMSHTHIGNMGAPCPLNPADITKLSTQLAVPDGDILSKHVKLG